MKSPKYRIVNVFSSFSGDVGFQALASWYGWAKEPIIQPDHSRIESIPDEIPINFVYGSRTHIDNSAAHQVLHQRSSDLTSIKVRQLFSIFLVEYVQSIFIVFFFHQL